MISFSEFIFKKLGVAAGSIWKGIFEKIKKFCDFVVKYIWVIVTVLVIVIIGIVILVLTVNKNNLGKCIEQGESNLTNNTNYISVSAYPNNNSFFEVQENSYEHEKDGGKMSALATLLDGTSIKKNNASPIIIEITGSWIPWFGDLAEKDGNGNITDTFQRDIATPNQTELCRFKKKTLGTDFDGTLQAREYYYLDNYYKDINFTPVNSKTTLDADTTVLDPVLQEPCWIEGGTGLYLGFYGVDGNGFPPHFHHLQANEMVCDPENFLRNYNYDTQNSKKIKAITTFDFGYDSFYNDNTNKNKDKYTNINGMTYGDFIYQNFSLNYAVARQNAYNACREKTTKDKIKECIDYVIKEERKNFIGIKEDNTEKKEILTEEEKNRFIKTENKYFLSYKDGYIIYNIRKHEKAMIDAGVKGYPELITKAQQAFKDACYYLKKTDDNQHYNVINAAKYRYREYFDEHRLMADYENNIDYKNKEIGKILLLDKYYSDNQGGYSLDFKSGFIVDTTSDKLSISSKFKEIEQFLLGTSKPHEDDDRTDGFIYKVYQNILDSGFETVAKAALALFVAIKGLYVILGFAEMKRKDFILFCIRIAFLFSIVDSNGWAFYNKTFINYFVNAVIGFVDLMAQIFNNVYDLVLPSSVVNGGMRVFEKSPTTTNAYEIWRYLTVFDNIFDFLKDPTLHKRIVSLIFVKGNPAIGIIMFLMSYFMLYKFIKAIITSIIPLIIITAQIAILLPLAPIFLVFMFFQRTETYFKNWVKNMASRSFELIVFFFVLFTTTGLINGKIQEFYSFKVCYRHLYSTNNEESAFRKESKLIEINKSKANWFLAATQNLVKFVFKTLFGQIIVPIPEGFFDVSLLAILLNFLILYFLIFMYSTINSSITQLMSKIFSFRDPQDKNDKGKFENAGSGLIGDKHNKLAPDVFDRLAKIGGRSIIEGASSMFSRDKDGNYTPRISTENSFLKNIGGVFKMGKDIAKKTAGFVNTASNGVLGSISKFGQQRRLDNFHNLTLYRLIQHQPERANNFIKRFENFVKTGNYQEFKKGNNVAGVKNKGFKEFSKVEAEYGKLLKNPNLTKEESASLAENIRITKEAINNLSTNAALLYRKYKKPDYSQNKDFKWLDRIRANIQLRREIKEYNRREIKEYNDNLLSKIKKQMHTIAGFTRNGIRAFETISAIRNKNGVNSAKERIIVDTGLTARFIKEINRKVQEANKLFEQGKIEDFKNTMTSINEILSNRNVKTFIKEINEAHVRMAKNKFANSSTKTGLADRLDIYTKLQEHLIEQFEKGEKLDLSAENKLLDIFKKIDNRTGLINGAPIDFSQLISEENKANSLARRMSTRANVLNMAVQSLASDLIKNGTIDEKAIDRFDYIVGKADKVNYTNNRDTFKEIAAIQTALAIDSSYVKELNELNKKLKEGNLSEVKKAETENRIKEIQKIRENSVLITTINEGQKKYGEKIEELRKKLDNGNIKFTERIKVEKEIKKLQELRDNFEKATIIDKIQKTDRTFERQETLLSKLEEYKSQKITEQRVANADRILSDLENKLNDKNITSKDKKEIKKQKEKVESIKKELRKIEKQKPNNDKVVKQERLLNELEKEFGSNPQVDKASLANIEKEINKTKERLDVIKALREQPTEKTKTLYEKLMKPLEVKATQTDMMLGLNSEETKSEKEVVKDRIKTLKKKLKTTEDAVAKAEIKEELEMLKNRDIDKLSNFYAAKDKFAEKTIAAQVDHIERINEANGDENKLQDAKELLKTQEDLITTQEKAELLRNGSADVLKAKLSNELETETDRIRKQELKEQIKAIDNNDKNGLKSLEQTLETQEKVADKTVEVYKSRENNNLVKENKIEIVKERLENEKAALNREAKTAADERRAEIETRKAKVQNDLNEIYKSERGEITNEQLQEHFERKEKVANTEINTINLEKVINNLPEQEKDALNGVVNALNQEISEINTNHEEFSTKEKAISELKERAIDIIKETVEEKNQFDIDNILADNFNMENFAPGTQAEAFTIKLDESAFIISTDAKSFNIVVNDNLYPCQVTEEGAIEVDPMVEQLKESFTVLKKANDFNIKILEYQLEKAKVDTNNTKEQREKKQNDINEQLEKAKVKNKRYEKQLNKKVGQ